MTTPQITALVVASGTWVGFASTLKTYFRCADQRTLAKTGLTLSAFACSVAQVAVIALVKPASAAWFWLGVCGFALANVVFWWALAAHGKSHPAFAFIRVSPSSLTTAGPYRMVRHPIYSAYLLAWCAGAAIVAQPLLLLGVVYMGLFYTIAARREERWFLASPLASRYREYKQRTGMFFPKASRLLFER
jgi:protein-S-isoprenylcysteine O-methyltransferase Ste14